MKKLFLFAALFTLSTSLSFATKYTVKSPDGKISLEITTGDKLTYSVYYEDAELISPSVVSMHTEKHGVFGLDVKVKKVKQASVDRMLSPVMKQKSAEIPEEYNEMKLEFKDKSALTFRVFNNGVAYRWESVINDEIIVVSEEANFNFSGDHTVWFPEEESLFSHQEREYLQEPLSAITYERFCSAPALIDVDGIKLVISEADLRDYPGMYLMGNDKELSLKGKFPRVVLEEEQTSDRDMKPVSRADYIAKTSGERTFPWRVIAIAENDGDLITNQMIYLLSEACKIEDPSWIKPGKVAWDWWNYNNIYGVDFEAGINTETYKYYIDFASEYGIEYIILDEGWYELGDLTAINPEIDMQELLEYGKEKGVGLILWVVWKTLDDQLEEVMPIFEEWGIAGLKIDFMQRDDQWMVNYYWRIAEECAKRELLVDFHGSYKPAGLHRTYPNVITREGVRGLEWNKWSDKATPEMAVTLPFIRMFAGPMDYTPGAMINTTKDHFYSDFARPMSQGTRCHQLAMYVVYESPLQMLADNPTHYYKEPECMEFLSEVPTVWDETVVLDAELGEYIIMARRSGDTWYLAGMTNWEKRELEVAVDFLDDDSYLVELWVDGFNAHRNANDYRYVDEIKEGAPLIFDHETSLVMRMAAGGGFVGILKPVQN